MRVVAIIAVCVAAFLIGWTVGAIAFIMAVARWVR